MRGPSCLRALSFVLPTFFFFLSFAGCATLGWFIALVLLAARRSSLLLIALRFLFTGGLRLFLSGLLLSRRIILLLLPTRLLALICFVCHLENSLVGLSNGPEMSISHARDVWVRCTFDAKQTDRRRGARRVGQSISSGVDTPDKIGDRRGRQ